MAKATVELTQAYQEVAVGAVAITVVKKGSGRLFFNESASDVNANIILPGLIVQFVQNETKSTFVRTDGAGWTILVDGVLT